MADKGIVVTTDNKVEIQDFGEPLYKTVGEAVGGFIEIVHPIGLAEPLVMIVNEEGLIHKLPVNTLGSLLYGTPEHGCPIVGNIVVMQTGFRDGEPDIVGLENEQIQDLTDIFRLFFRSLNTKNSIFKENYHD